MAKKKKKRGRSRRRAVDSWKLKEWYEVYAPRSFKEKFIGEIPAANPDNLVGRVIETLLYDFTQNFDHAHIKLRFKIKEVKGNRCETRFIGHELTRDFVRSLIHRGTSRIEGIFDYKTADGFVYRVSSFVVTVRRVRGSQIKTIRKVIHEVLKEFAKSSKHGKFTRGMIYGKYAENIAKIVKTIYPIKECQVRKSKLITFPEGVEDEDYDEDESFEERRVKLEENGKSIKAKQKARKRAQRHGDGGDSEEPDESEEDSEESDDDAKDESEEKPKEEKDEDESEDKDED